MLDQKPKRYRYPLEVISMVLSKLEALIYTVQSALGFKVEL